MIEPEAQHYTQSRHSRPAINFDRNSQIRLDNGMAAEGIMQASRAQGRARSLSE